MGGADQWGNITAGLELIRRTSGSARGRTPIRRTASPTSCCSRRRARSSARARVVRPSGSIRARTSPYAFYQHWLNTDDRDVGTYLRWFTELSREEIEALEAETAARPEARAGPAGARARHHRPDARGGRGRRGRRRCPRRCSRIGSIGDPAALASLFQATGGFTFTGGVRGQGCRALLAEAGLFASKGEATPLDRRRRRDDQRGASDRPGLRPGTHRRGVARRPDRQAPPRDRPPRRLGALVDGARRVAPTANAARRGGRPAAYAWRARSASMTADGGRPRSASSTSAW